MDREIIIDKISMARSNANLSARALSQMIDMNEKTPPKLSLRGSSVILYAEYLGFA